MDAYIKITLSLLLSFVLGVERERHHKAVGLRSCMLLCFCMTLFCIINERLCLFYDGNYDILRLPAYCIMSIGFLGSSVIICYKHNIEGVTTACLLFALVAIGLSCGIEEYQLATIATIVVYGILKLKHVQRYFITKVE